MLWSLPDHAVFTLKRLHGQRTQAFLWSQETRLQKLPLSTFVVQKQSWLKWMIKPWIIYTDAHICITQLFFLEMGILGSLVSWHCMSAKNMRIENFLRLSFLCSYTGCQRGFSHFRHWLLYSIQITIKLLWCNDIIESSKQVLSP